MAKFCEDCPLKGSAIGELVDSDFYDVDMCFSGLVITEVGRTVGTLLDEYGNASKPLYGDIENSDSIIAKVDACNEPIAEVQEKILPYVLPAVKKVCPAIGHLAISDKRMLRFIDNDTKVPVNEQSS